MSGSGAGRTRRPRRARARASPTRRRSGNRRRLRLARRRRRARALPCLFSRTWHAKRTSADSAEHCAAAGRDYDEIEKTVGTRADLEDDPDKRLGEALDRLRELADVGFDHAILGRRGPWTEESIAALASILPEVHALGAGPGR